MIDALENLVYPKYLEEKLEEIYDNKNAKIRDYREQEETEKKEKITDFFKYKFIEKGRSVYKLNFESYDIISPIDSSSNFKKISLESSLYFKQGKELLDTAIDMSELTSPIIQYYGLLQCVKGAILLDYELKHPLFFLYHGVTIDNCKTILTKDNNKVERKLRNLQQSSLFTKLRYPIEFQTSKYCNIKIMPFGVFSALLIHQSNKMSYTIDGRTDMDFFLSGNCSSSLEELINSRRIDIYKVFIISWIISSLVRYNPILWQEMVSGSKDTIIKQLIDFMRYIVPNSIMDLLNPYLPNRISDFY